VLVVLGAVAATFAAGLVFCGCGCGCGRRSLAAPVMAHIAANGLALAGGVVRGPRPFGVISLPAAGQVFGSHAGRALPRCGLTEVRPSGPSMMPEATLRQGMAPHRHFT